MSSDPRAVERLTVLPIHRYHGISAPGRAILNPLAPAKPALVENICSSTLALGTLAMMRAIAADDAQAQNG